MRTKIELLLTVLISVLCTLPLFAQRLVAETNQAKFYVYEEAIWLIGENKVIFSGKYTKGRVVEISSFLVNCKSYTFVKLSHQRQVGKSVTNPPFRPTIIPAKKGSAMEHAINFSCTNDKIKQPDDGRDSSADPK